jgi:hypothetical protein
LTSDSASSHPRIDGDVGGIVEPLRNPSSVRPRDSPNVHLSVKRPIPLRADHGSIVTAIVTAPFERP